MPNETYVVTAYTELCRTYQGLHEFRMKLLGLLPIASIAALLALLSKATSQLPAPESLEAKIIGYIGVFSALFTSALFIYEARGILMCHDLYHTGKALEAQMGVQAQFHECDERRHLPCYDTPFKRALAPKINNMIASCAVYSLTFAAWFFVALRFAFHKNPENCALLAALTGIGLAAASFTVLWLLTTSSNDAETPCPVEPAELGAEH